MASLHTFKSIAKAAEKGGYAGLEEAWPLWDLPKRQLVEVALRLGVLVADSDDISAAVSAVNAELDALKANKII